MGGMFILWCMVVFGILLCMTGIGAVIGVPMFFMAAHFGKVFKNEKA